MPTERIDATLIPADESDIEAMAALWAEAFPEKPADRRQREIREGMTYGDLSDCWVVKVEGRLAGALRTYRFTTHLRGREFPTMGLAGVATAPDFRRRGIGRRMCIAALEMAHARGDVLSVLYPFRTSFYRELGYVLVGSLHRYRFRTDELATYAGWDRVARAPEDGPALARAIYDRVAPTTNGLLARTERMWGFLEEEGQYLYLHRDEGGEATGYIVVRGRGGPPDKATLVVRELVAVDREAYLALLGWLSVQRDQWAEIVYDALPGEDFQRRLAHPRTRGSGTPRGLWFHSAHLLRGPMLRIVNLERALEGFSDVAGVEGEVLVRDTQLPANQGVWSGGRRVRDTLDAGRTNVLPIADVSALFAEGRLACQPPVPDGWQPNLGLPEFRLLDEF